MIDTQGKRGYKSLFLLEVQPGKLAVIPLGHTCGPQQFIVQLLPGIRDIDDQEGHKEHSFISALQVTENILCFARVSGNIGRDYVHIETFPDRPLLSVDLHTVNIRDLPFDGLDGIILIHTADMEAHQHIAVRFQQFRQNTVVHFRGIDLEEGCSAIFSAHEKTPCLSETEGGRCNKVLHMEAGRCQPVPIEGKTVAVRVHDAMQQRQPFPAVQSFCQCADHLKLVQGIQDDPGKPRPCGSDILCFYGQDQQLCFYKSVVSSFQLLA